MKLKRWMSYAMVAAMGVGLFCFGPSPATAEDEIGTQSEVSVWGPLRYKTYQYPSKSTGFFFFPKSYVTFDIVNGKYWQVESTRVDYQVPNSNGWDMVFPLFTRKKNMRPEQMSATFYTPDMKVLGTFNYFQANHKLSIPRDGNDYERIICRLECNGDQNWDVKMRVWDAIDPVIAEPIGGARWRP